MDLEETMLMVHRPNICDSAVGSSRQACVNTKMNFVFRKRQGNSRRVARILPFQEAKILRRGDGCKGTKSK